MARLARFAKPACTRNGNLRSGAEMDAVALCRGAGLRHAFAMERHGAIANLDAARRLLSAELEALSEERVVAAFLDRHHHLLTVACVGDGGRDHAAFPVRAIIGHALACDAEAILVAHNHPSGIAVPSRADRVATQALCAAARPLALRIVDHLVFAGGGVASFRQLGLL